MAAAEISGIIGGHHNQFLMLQVLHHN